MNHTRAGLQELRGMAEERERTDIIAQIDAIVAMSDQELVARSHEIQGLRHLGLDPIQCGYLEACVRRPAN